MDMVDWLGNKATRCIAHSMRRNVQLHCATALSLSVTHLEVGRLLLQAEQLALQAGGLGLQPRRLLHRRVQLLLRRGCPLRRGLRRLVLRTGLQLALQVGQLLPQLGFCHSSLSQLPGAARWHTGLGGHFHKQAQVGLPLLQQRGCVGKYRSVSIGVQAALDSLPGSNRRSATHNSCQAGSLETSRQAGRPARTRLPLVLLVLLLRDGLPLLAAALPQDLRLCHRSLCRLPLLLGGGPGCSRRKGGG